MIKSKSFTLGFTLLFFITTINAQVGIGNTNPQGALDISSTTDGLLIPRVALVNLATVTVDTPTESELVYNTATINDVTPGYYYLSTATGPWVRIGGATGWLTTGNADITATSFMGTSNNFDVAFRRNGVAAGRIGSTSTSYGVGALNSGGPSNSTAIGNRALALGTGNNNVAIGQDAFGNNASGAQWNVAIGVNALRANTASSTQNNVAIGFDALANETGEVNQSVAIGSGAARGSRGNNNVAIGYWALAGNNGVNTGIDNVAIGKLALQFDTSGQQNTALGSEALKFLTTGSFNTSVGHLSGAAVTTGNNNSFLGINAGNNVTTGTNNTAIGSGAQVPTGINSNQVRIGNNAVTYAGVQVAWTVTSDKRWKDNINISELGLEFLQTIRPVSYVRKNDENQKTEYGFIAQELEEALVKAGNLTNGIISKDDKGMYSVRYNDFISISVKAIQEQQDQIEALKTENELLKKTNEEIIKRLEALEKK